jgi:hypothetical protein
MPYVQFKTYYFGGPPRTVPALPKSSSMKSIFADNSRVYYKPHTLASGGVGTVRNSHSKSKRT